MAVSKWLSNVYDKVIKEEKAQEKAKNDLIKRIEELEMLTSFKELSIKLNKKENLIFDCLKYLITNIHG